MSSLPSLGRVSCALETWADAHPPPLPPSIYLPIMETVYKGYFKEWMSDPSPPKEYVPRPVSPREFPSSAPDDEQADVRSCPPFPAGT